MSRITKALEKLRVKCTEAGAHPNGKDTADILECIAEHYVGGGAMVVNVTNNGSGGYTIDKNFSELLGACPNVIAVIDSGVQVLQLYNYGAAQVTFMTVGAEGEDGDIEYIEYSICAIHNDGTVAYAEGEKHFN